MFKVINVNKPNKKRKFDAFIKPPSESYVLSKCIKNYKTLTLNRSTEPLTCLQMLKNMNMIKSNVSTCGKHDISN